MTANAISVGIVGTGEIAQAVHLPLLLLLSHQYRLVAICDVSPRAVKHCADKFRVGKTYGEYSEMLKDPAVELVFILTGDEYHTTLAVKAADAKKHVFIEKPMALTHEDAERIIEAEERNQVVIFVGFMRRYATAYLEAKKIITEMQKIDYVRVRDIIGHNHFFVAGSGTFAERFTDIPAAATEDRSERLEKIKFLTLGLQASERDMFTYRLLGNLGSHGFSAMRELIGLPRGCFAAARSSDAQFITAMLDFDGFTALYECGMDGCADFDAHIEVHGDGKRVKIFWPTPWVKGLPVTATIRETSKDGQHKKTVLRPTYIDTYTLQFDALYQSIREGIPHKTTPKDASLDLLTLDMIMGAMRS